MTVLEGDQLPSNELANWTDCLCCLNYYLSAEELEVLLYFDHWKIEEIFEVDFLRLGMQGMLLQLWDCQLDEMLLEFYYYHLLLLLLLCTLCWYIHDQLVDFSVESRKAIQKRLIFNWLKYLTSQNPLLYSINIMLHC